MEPAHTILPPLPTNKSKGSGMKKRSYGRAVVVLSGGFDPMHRGHVGMFRAAAELGDVVVVVNSDRWLERKKGRVFMGWSERAAVVGGMAGVMAVVKGDDGDGTVAKNLERIGKEWRGRKLYFGNGGDRGEGRVPVEELFVCERFGIEVLYGLGGGKVQSSSELLDRWRRRGSEERCWGSFWTVIEDRRYKVKELIVNAGKATSIQVHQHRSELWMVVEGELFVECGGHSTGLVEGEYFHVPRRYVHRISNKTKKRAILIEVQYGDKVDEADILRLKEGRGDKRGIRFIQGGRKRRV